METLKLQASRMDERGYLFDIMNPFVVRMMGANINRRTIENINNAGWNNIKDEPLSFSIVRWIETTPKT
jgi:hypothetical protein